MPIPTNAFEWKAVMDPTDQVEYVIDLKDPDKPLLEAGETIASYTLTLLAESVAVGLTISTGPRAPVLINGSTGIRVWFEVDSGNWSNAAFNGDGARLPMELTVTTSTTPSRRRQRTLVLKVAQQ